MRDVQYSARLGRLATLTTNGAVQLWDPHLSNIRSVRASPCLPRCMGLRGSAALHRRQCDSTCVVLPNLSRPCTA